MVKVSREFMQEHYDFNDLVQIMSILRGENGCPWDREQTHNSIRNDLLEEAYEVADAIDRNDSEGLCEELGDLLLQVVFHSQISKENNEFTFDDVADGICKKLIFRHPHIFSNVVVKNSEEVLNNWDKLKLKEKKMSTFTETLKAVPNAFPACMRAQKVQKRASKAGFDLESVTAGIEKIEKKLAGIKQSLALNESTDIADELGNLLFSVVNVARVLKVDSEEQLSRATDKFVARFEKAEDLAGQENKKLNELSKNELETIRFKVDL